MSLREGPTTFARVPRANLVKGFGRWHELPREVVLPGLFLPVAIEFEVVRIGGRREDRAAPGSKTGRFDVRVERSTLSREQCPPSERTRDERRSLRPTREEWHSLRVYTWGLSRSRELSRKVRPTSHPRSTLRGTRGARGRSRGIATEGPRRGFWRCRPGQQKGASLELHLEWFAINSVRKSIHRTRP